MPLAFITNTPGPGTYHQSAKIGEGPKYGLRPRTAISQTRFGPGPAQYSPSKAAVQLRPPSAVMGRGSRNGSLTMGFGPGPGAYVPAPKGRFGPSFSFGTAVGANKKNLNPGPGTYKIPCSFASLPKYLSPSKHEEFEYV